jgi:hypothetical protein
MYEKSDEKTRIFWEPRSARFRAAISPHDPLILTISFTFLILNKQNIFKQMENGGSPLKKAGIV